MPIFHDCHVCFLVSKCLLITIVTFESHSHKKFCRKNKSSAPTLKIYTFFSFKSFYFYIFLVVCVYLCRHVHVTTLLWTSGQHSKIGPILPLCGLPESDSVIRHTDQAPLLRESFHQSHFFLSKKSTFTQV